MKHNVLVTGGAGYIGSHICKALSLAGYNPITFDNFSTGHRSFVKWGPLFEGELLNVSHLEQVFCDYKIESVVHVAAKAYVEESMQNPIKYYKENIFGITNLLEAFLNHGGKNFIFSSSCATYGEPEVSPITESTLQAPINPYGFSKLAGEKLIKSLSRNNDFNFAILRYFNVAGADSSLEIGELHENETHLFPLLIDAAYKKNTFNIFGSDYDTADGTAERDYIHVSDLADAHMVAFKTIKEGKRELVVNLGTGKSLSVMEITNMARSIFPDLQITFKERRVGDPPRLESKSEVGKDIFNWRPTRSTLENIFYSAVDWHQSLEINLKKESKGKA